MKVIALTRVSKGSKSGVSHKVQRAAIEARAEAGWSIDWITETVSGTGRKRRPELEAALERLDRGDADMLVTFRMDRLSRSVIDFANILKRSRDHGWRLLTLDLGVDFSTPQGKLVGQQMISFAEYEAEIIGIRTKEALAVKRREGKPVSRPSVAPAVARRIRRQHRRGWSLAKIADKLNADQVPTARGGSEWYRSTVRSVLARA
jgi:DNA invertase Pin-like site-specific DNA recombinase